MRRAVMIAGALLLAWPLASNAHEIPRRVTVQAFVKPEADRLRVLVRVPLEAMRDVEFALRGPGYLDLARSDTLLRDAARLWVADGVIAYADGVRLADARIVATRASLPSDHAFDSYNRAIAQTTGISLPPDTDVPWRQAMLDVLLEYDITSDSAEFAIRPAFAGLGVRTNTVVRFLPPHGAERVFMYEGDPGMLQLDPGPLNAAWRFVRLGFTHVLAGTDHLLFLVCLVLPFRAIRPLIALVTSFTLAHSITLSASAFGFAPDALWFPPLVEAVIALSIVYVACENMLGAKLERRWMVAFGFGLVHGFGFSFALRESLQFAGSHLLTSLAAFNVGVEVGQLAVLVVAVPALGLLFRRVPERAGTILLSAFVAHTAWHWTTERGSALAQYRFKWPAIDALLLANAMRAAMVLLVIGGAGWLLHGLLKRWVVRPSGAVVLCAVLMGAGGVTVAARVSAAQGTSHKPVSASVQAPVTRTTMAGVYTAGQARQGREVFIGTCTGCHTPASHTGVVFTARWVGRSVDDLFNYIRNSMPKIAPGSLTEDEYVWVTAYILKLNGMPAGPAELSAEPAMMRALRIDTVFRSRKRSGR